MQGTLAPRRFQPFVLQHVVVQGPLITQHHAGGGLVTVQGAGPPQVGGEVSGREHRFLGVLAREVRVTRR